MKARIRASARFSNRRLRFLKAVSKDLRSLNISCSVRKLKSTLVFAADFGDFTPETTLSRIRQMRKREIAAQYAIFGTKSLYNERDCLADVEKIDVDSIEPYITFCQTKADYEWFGYLSLVHSLPVPRLLFRRICAIVRDAGQPEHPAIGILALSSSVFSLAGRDEYFGWSSAAGEAIKRRRLVSSMHLNVCMAIPPYDLLRGGRLIAALSATDEVASRFSRCYRTKGTPDTLHAVVTTCASGIHSPIFNRIMVRPGGLFRRVGVTSGYSTHFYSSEAIAAARDIVKDRHPGVRTDGARTIQLLKYALDECNIPREALLRLGVRKGVYIAHGGQGSLNFLRGNCNDAVATWPTLRDVVLQWKKRELPKAINRVAAQAQVSVDDMEKYIAAI